MPTTFCTQSMLFIVPFRHRYSSRLEGAACWWPWTTILINEYVQKLNYSLDHSLPQLSPFHCFACSLLSPSALSQVFLLLHLRSCFFRSLSHSSSILFDLAPSFLNQVDIFGWFFVISSPLLLSSSSFFSSPLRPSVPRVPFSSLQLLQSN